MFEKLSLSGVSNEAWLRLRKAGIGGSDAGVICGVNPYSSAMKVFQDKTSEAVEEQDSEAIRIGHDLEDYVAQRFTEATGFKVRKSNFMYRSKGHPFMIADVDRVVVGEDEAYRLILKHEEDDALEFDVSGFKNGKLYGKTFM